MVLLSWTFASFVATETRDCSFQVHFLSDDVVCVKERGPRVVDAPGPSFLPLSCLQRCTRNSVKGSYFLMWEHLHLFWRWNRTNTTSAKCNQESQTGDRQREVRKSINFHAKKRTARVTSRVLFPSRLTCHQKRGTSLSMRKPITFLSYVWEETEMEL